MGLIDRVISSKSKINLLRIFHDYPDREFSLYDLKKIFKLSPGTMHPILSSLAKDRILISRRIGNTTLYKLNYKNLIVKKILEIFDSERDALVNKAREFVKKIKKSGIVSIILFGSVATGKATEMSDIDLLIIYDKNFKNIKEDALKLSEQFLEEDIIITPMFLSKIEVKNMLRKYDSFILRVQGEGKILFGKSLERI